jgi:hypothetical protein
MEDPEHYRMPLLMLRECQLSLQTRLEKDMSPSFRLKASNLRWVSPIRRVPY